MNIFKKIKTIKQNKISSVPIEPQTSWKFEDNLTVYNMLSHLNHLKKLDTITSNIKEFNENTVFLKHFAEKLTKNGVSNQLLMLKNRQNDNLGLILDCGGNFWSITGDLESVFQYLDIPKHEQEQSFLIPFDEHVHQFYPIDNFIIKNSPELLNIDYPLHVPIQWKQISYLNVKTQPYIIEHADPNKDKKEIQAFFIQSHKENFKLHQQKEFQHQQLNELAQELIQSSDKTKMKIFELHVHGEEKLELVDAIGLHERLKEVGLKIKTFKEQFQLEGRAKTWFSYIQQKTIHMMDSILEIKGENHEFISETFERYSSIVGTHQKIQLKIQNPKQEQLFVQFLRLALTLKKEMPISEDNKGELSFSIFKNHFLIHSKQNPYIYSLNTPNLECIQKNAQKTLITIDKKQELWYRMNEHPFFQHLEKILNQITLNDKLKSNHKTFSKPKGRF